MRPSSSSRVLSSLAFVAAVTVAACDDGDAPSDDGGVLGDAAAAIDASVARDAAAADVVIRDAAADASTDVSTDAFTPDAQAGDAGDASFSPLRLGATQSLTQACGVAVAPGGSLFVVGHTNGALTGSDARGARDLFLAHVRADGAVDWIRQLGDSGPGVAVFTGGCAVTAGTNGEAYVAGTVNGRGSFEGEPLPHTFTALVARFDSSGARTWVGLTGEASGPTEAMAVDVHGGVVRVLGWTQAALDGTTSQQGDVFLAQLDGSTGQRRGLQRFASPDEDLPLGFARDGSGLWVGLRRFRTRAGTFVGHELVQLDAAGQQLRRLSGDAEPGFAVIDFTLGPSGDPVLLGATAGEDQRGYALRVHGRDGVLGPVVAGRRAAGLQVRAFSCDGGGCAVAGQTEERPDRAPTDAIHAFVDLLGPDLAPRSHVFIESEGGAAMSAAGALASAGNRRWYVAGWSAARVLGLPRIGSTDGFVARVE